MCCGLDEQWEGLQTHIQFWRLIDVKYPVTEKGMLFWRLLFKHMR